MNGNQNNQWSRFRILCFITVGVGVIAICARLVEAVIRGLSLLSQSKVQLLGDIAVIITIILCYFAAMGWKKQYSTPLATIIAYVAGVVTLLNFIISF